MDRLYAPWRKDFIERTEPREDGCIFCNRKVKEPSAGSLVLMKGVHSFVVLNKYPYTNGHLMVAPLRHTAGFASLTPDECAEMQALLQRCVSALTEAYRPQGFNMGMNLGEVAGAGVAEHLHWHVVPRWGGDTNFMPVTGGAKVLHEMLDDTFERLHPFFR